MSMVYGGTKADDYQHIESEEIHVPDSCYAIWRPDLDGAGTLLREKLGYAPPGSQAAHNLTQNQQDLEAGTTTGFIAAAATLTNSAVSPHGGSRCLLVTPDGAASGEGITAPDKFATYPAAASGQSWRWKCWCNPPAGETVRFTMYELPGYGNTTADIVGDGTYQQMTLNRTLSQAGTTTIWLMARTTAAGQAAWRMDDFELYRTDITNANSVLTGATWVQGPTGRILSFDGADDYGKILGDVIGNGAVSVEALIYLVGWGETGYGRILDNTKFFIGTATGTPGSFFCSSNGSTSLYSAVSYSLNTWYHVLVTRSAAGVGTFYINGIVSGTPGTTGTPAAASDTYFGNRAAGDRTLNGYIAMIRMYNKVLTAGEAQEAYYDAGPLVGLG